MAISNYFGILSLLFNYLNNIQSQKSVQILNQIPLFGTQLFEYSNNSNYLFKHWYFVPELYNCPKARGVRTVNFYICPHLNNACNEIFKKILHFVLFLVLFLKKRGQILIKSHLKCQNYWKNYEFWIFFYKNWWILVIFSYFCPFTTKFFLFLPPPPKFLTTDILYTTEHN